MSLTKHIFIFSVLLGLVISIPAYTKLQSKTANNEHTGKFNFEISERDLIERFTKSLNEELPGLNVFITDDGASELKTVIINAARTIINEKAFDRLDEADRNIKSFARFLIQKGRDKTVPVRENKLTPIENTNASTDTNANVNNRPQNENINLNSNNNVNRNENISTPNSNANASPTPFLLKKIVFNKPQPPTPSKNAIMQETDLTFERTEISARTVITAYKSTGALGGICPLFPICR